MPRPISLTISSAALQHNLHAVRARLHSASGGAAPRVWAVMKARGYGHGVAAAVAGFADADGLAMLDLDEAVQCRELGWRGPILMLEGHFHRQDLDVFAQWGLTTVLHAPEQLDMLAGWSAARPLDAYLKIDSGMGRLGFLPDQVAEAGRRVADMRRDRVLGVVGYMTHFARADDAPEVSQRQLDVFRQSIGPEGPVSYCNTAAALDALWRAWPPQRPQWVRVGVGLYGGSPFVDRPASGFGLQPAMTLRSALIAVRELPDGAGVGYGHVYSAVGRQRIGVVACGYGDGYPRHAPTGTPVQVDGVRTRLLGRVSMDMLMVDLTPVPQARVGSPVVLWGQGGPDIDEVAHCSGTIGYELMCGVTSRVPREFVGPGASS